jgi:glycosyltransferase involved in cell wall biosynthesis
MDVFHIHGLWMMPNVYPAVAARLNARPLVLSPHGMLGKDALRFSWPIKRAFWVWAQERAVRQVNCFHATSEKEYENIREFGLKQPVAIIALGIDLPPMEMFANMGETSTAPYVVSLGRIHPKKALDRLIRAWALVEHEFPKWRLKIVGPSEMGYAETLKKLVLELGIATVEITGPVFDQEKLTLLCGAELFVLPTLDDNFAMTVPESLVCGTPVISSKGAPWQGLEMHGCGWWLDHGVEPLAAALRRAMSLPREERWAMGARGRAWMERDFTWAAAALQMVQVYQWLIEGGGAPKCVRLY